jgi:hypothetical protein
MGIGVSSGFGRDCCDSGRTDVIASPTLVVAFVAGLLPRAGSSAAAMQLQLQLLTAFAQSTLLPPAV